MSLRELERLQAIHRYLNLQIDKDTDLQEIVELVAELLACPVAMITFAEEGLQRIPYKTGEDLQQDTHLNIYYQHLALKEGLLIVPDIRKDERFAAYQNVGGVEQACFYAGAILKTHDGHELGSLCVLDTKPNDLNAAQQHLLKLMAKRVVQIIEFEYSINLLKNQFLQARDAEVKLRSVFESSDVCHLLLNKDFNVMDFNRPMAELFWRMHEVTMRTGVNMGDMLTHEPREDFLQNFMSAINGKPIRYKRQVTHRNGEKVWWYVSFLPCYDLEGNVVCISYNATDITENTVHKELVSVQNKSLRQIAFIQSHELRKPVATILGLMEVIRLTYREVLPEEMRMMEEATTELDNKIREIVKLTV